MTYIGNVIENVIRNNPGEMEFHQAVREVLESLEPVIERHPEIPGRPAGRLVEPERQVMFRDLDDEQNQDGKQRLSRHSIAMDLTRASPFSIRLGNLGITNLAFEQIFKNS